MNDFHISNSILSNGLKVFYAHVPKTAGFEIALHCDTGSRDEPLEVNGVSHFLEHMMFRGTTNYRNSIELATALESFGGEANAMTSNENTVYWVKGSAAKFSAAIGVFAEFLHETNYADLELERSIILQEMAGEYNEKGDNIDIESLAMEAMFGLTGLGLPIIGNETTVGRIAAEDLQRKKNLFYTPNNSILTVTSPVPLQQAHPWLESEFGARWSGNNKQPRVKHSHLAANQNLCLQNNPDNQYALKIMALASGGNDASVIEQTLVQRILDDGIASRLPSTIREQHGLVYDISCDSVAYSDIGTFSIDATISDDKLEKLMPVLLDQLVKIKLDLVTQDELDRVKFRYRYDIQTIQESANRTMSREVSNSFFAGQMSVKQELEILDSVTTDVIRSCAVRCLANPIIALVGPKALKKRALLHAFLEQLA